MKQNILNKLTHKIVTQYGCTMVEIDDTEANRQEYSKVRSDRLADSIAESLNNNDVVVVL